jgi:hypothetical protein
MAFLDVILGAIAGGLVLLMLGPLIKRKCKTDPNRRLASTIVVILAFGASQVVLTPVVQAFSAAAEIDEALQNNPTFVVLKTHDVETYNSFTKSMRERYKGGATHAEIVAEAQSKMRGIVMSKLPASSNEAAVTYLKATTAELEHLYQAGGDKCYAYLHPAPGKAAQPRIDFTPELIQADLAALAEVLRAAYVSPQPIPTDEAFEAVLSKSFAQYLQANSVELNELEKPKASEQERRAVCRATVSLYQEIFKLPMPAAGTVIRYMLAPASSPQN